MNAQEFTELLEKPVKVQEVDVRELRELAHEFPYSQPLQLLYAFRLKSSSEHLFNQQLGRTSILTNNREVLFDLFEDGNSFPEEKEEVKETTEKPERNGFQYDWKEEAEKSGILPHQVVMAESGDDDISDKEETPEKEEDRGSGEQEKAKEKGREAEEDLSHLPAAERIKAILERNRKLREEFEKRHIGESPVDSRVKRIREQLEALKDERKQNEIKNKEKKSNIPEEIPRERSIEEADEEKTGLTPAETGEANEGDVDEKNPSVTLEERSPENIETLDEEALTDEHRRKQEQEDIKITAEDDEQSGNDKNGSEPVFTIDDDSNMLSSESQIPSFAPIEPGEVHRFSEWLKRIAGKAGEDDSVTSQNSDGELGFDKKMELLDSFMEKLPDLKMKGRSGAPQSVSSTIDMGTVNPTGDGALVTETLAQVYIKQGHFEKAMKAYQILKLKYPEKSGFFADRILEIKKLINSK